MVLTETLQKKILNSNYKAILSKTAFQTNFGPREVPQSESESAGFLVWALPAVQNQFGKQFCSKVQYNYGSIFF